MPSWLCLEILALNDISIGSKVDLLIVNLKLRYLPSDFFKSDRAGGKSLSNSDNNDINLSSVPIKVRI